MPATVTQRHLLAELAVSIIGFLNRRSHMTRSKPAARMLAGRIEQKSDAKGLPALPDHPRHPPVHLSATTDTRDEDLKANPPAVAESSRRNGSHEP